MTNIILLLAALLFLTSSFMGIDRLTSGRKSSAVYCGLAALLSLSAMVKILGVF